MEGQTTFVIVISTGGSVMNQLLHNPFFKSRVQAVVSDRECPAITKADTHGVRTVIIPESDKGRFSARVLGYLKSQAADYAISFYSKLFVGELLNEYRDRIINYTLIYTAHSHMSKSFNSIQSVYSDKLEAS